MAYRFPAILTVLGWGFLVKSVPRFCFPQQGLRMMAPVSHERAWEFRVPGVIYLIVVGLLASSVLRG